MRISEFASEMGVSSKEVIAALKKAKITGKVAASTITAKEQEKVKKFIEPPKPAKKTASKTTTKAAAKPAEKTTTKTKAAPVHPRVNVKILFIATVKELTVLAGTTVAELKRHPDLSGQSLNDIKFIVDGVILQDSDIITKDVVITVSASKRNG